MASKQTPVAGAVPEGRHRHEHDEDDDGESSSTESGSTESGSSSSGSDSDSGDEESGESGSTASSSDDDDDDDEEEEEPKLKYQRLGASVAEILKTHAATCMAVAGKFIVLGTDWGSVHVLDSINGTESESFNLHEARVNALAIDANREYVASCADDGKVVVRSLYEPDNKLELTFDRPVKSVAIDPSYHHNKKRPVCTGGLAGDLVLNERSRLGIFVRNSPKVLHRGEGPIHTITWRGIFIAWANDLGVKIFDTSTQQRISFIDRPKDSPRPDLYRCRLAWKDDLTLLIGWADSIKVAVIKENPQRRADAATGNTLPTRFCELVAIFQVDFFVAGLAPFGDNLVCLAFVEDDDEDEEEEGETGGGAAAAAAEKKTKKAPRGSGASSSQRPELRVLSLRNEEISSDALSIRGFERYRCNDYHLEALVEENFFYVVSPKDIVVARPCDLDDHITWLQGRGRFEEAMRAAEGHERELRTHDMDSIRQKYLADLIERGEYEQAASACPAILGTDAKSWELWICTFAKIKQLKSISNFIPIDKPRLSPNTYEMVLSEFLRDDPVGFQQTIREWPVDLYDIHKIIPAVAKRIDANPPGVEIYAEALGELYTLDKQYDKSLHIYLKLKRGSVFALIRDQDLFYSIQDKIVLLMEFDAAKAVDLLVHHEAKVHAKDVIHQLRDHPRYQFMYLEALTAVDQHAARDFGKLQVELTAEYHPERLMNFLRTSNYVPLKDAMKICEERKMIPEMVFLLQRVGNTTRALDLIISELGDVEAAIDFAKDVNDDELWDQLIKKSLDKPDFIRGLLNNTGTHINPIILIRAIPTGMEIPGLRDSLVKILQDYNLQIELRKGCRDILTTDSVMLLRKLNKMQKQGMHQLPGHQCLLCHVRIDSIAGDARQRVVLHRCGHAFHLDCLEGHLLASSGPAARAAAKTGHLYCPLCSSTSEDRGVRGRSGHSHPSSRQARGTRGGRP